MRCIRILLSLLSGLDKVGMTHLEFNKDDLGTGLTDGSPIGCITKSKNKFLLHGDFFLFVFQCLFLSGLTFVNENRLRCYLITGKNAENMPTIAMGGYEELAVNLFADWEDIYHVASQVCQC